MQSFWNKMNEIETRKLQAVDPVSKQQDNKTNPTLKSINVKTQKKAPKPRKRTPTTNSVLHQKSDHPEVKIVPNSKEIRNLNQKKLSRTPSVIVLKETNVNFDSDDETESESSEESVSSESSEEEESHESIIKPQHNVTSKPSHTSTLGQRSLTRFVKYL